MSSPSLLIDRLHSLKLHFRQFTSYSLQTNKYACWQFSQGIPPRLHIAGTLDTGSRIRKSVQQRSGSAACTDAVIVRSDEGFLRTIVGWVYDFSTQLVKNTALVCQYYSGGIVEPDCGRIPQYKYFRIHFLRGEGQRNNNVTRDKSTPPLTSFIYLRFDFDVWDRCVKSTRYSIVQG